MQRGYVKSIVGDRGFGFIRRVGQADCFFHMRELPPELSFGEWLVDVEVEFEIQASDKGPRAIGIRAAR